MFWFVFWSFIILIWTGFALASLPEHSRSPMMRLWQPRHPTIAILAMVIGVIGTYVGLLDADTFDSQLWNFFVDLAPEMVGMAFTVAVIDELGERRVERLEKRRVIEQIGSQVNSAALEAIRIAMKNDWLYDGSLKGVELSMANLEGADLRDADFEGASMINTNLEKATLWGANFTQVNLCYANLAKAQLTRANLPTRIMKNHIPKTFIDMFVEQWLPHPVGYLHEEGQKVLRQSAPDFEKANLTGSSLEKADLRYAKFVDTNLYKTNLKKADLGNAIFKGASLVFTELLEADLREANLEKADLTGANLVGAILYRANLKEAYLGRANLSGANLREANLYNTNLEGITYDESTIWPDGYKAYLNEWCA